ncbi:MAG TPA: DUF1028 domain-containing protein [Stellaceae bacterium]|nr:DUF1028 domain-containing protein [Stellaceae bacterium]
MTFSILGRCERTGMFGVAVSSSSPCVASRCGNWARAGIGAVATQNVTDPRLGHLGLVLLRQGFGARAVLAQLVGADIHADYRQLMVIDQNGRTAHHSGAKTLGRHAAAEGAGCVAAGNLLADDGVPQAMVEAFCGAAASHLAERLMRALEAGRAAGGEAGPVRSAGIYVVDRYVWPICDLRVDWHDAPIAELRRIWGIYEPQMADYVTRAIDPSAAPSYGVAGDP